jgi:hypothetical protein
MLVNQGEKRNAAVFSRILTGILLFAAIFYAYTTLLALLYGPDAISLSMGCRWDCGWYKAIIQHGYVSTIPPTPQDEHHSNVAFFPLFPMLGAAVGSLLSISSDLALPLVSVVFAFGIWLLLPSLTTRKRLYLLAAYPASFYFFVAYSESVYCFCLFAGVLVLLKRRSAPFGLLAVAALGAGLGLGLTRLTGFVIPGAVFGLAVLGVLFCRVDTDRRLLLLSGLWTFGAVLGAASFFYYAYAKFGVWNLYFQTLDIGWHKEVSLRGFFYYFGRALTKNLLPPLFARDPVRMSWILTADTIVALTAVLVYEGRRLVRAATGKIDADRFLRLALLAGSFVHLMITTTGDSGDWHRWGNGMRYTMPVFYLLVFLWDDAWWPKFLANRPKWRRNLYAGLLAFWIPYQLYYLYLFTQTAWVS